jgi:hypothetical protein
MPDGERAHKLISEEQLFVCACIAGGMNAELIKQELDEKYGKKVSVQNIYQGYIHAPKWKKRIESITKAMDKELAKHPLAKKETRLNFVLAALNEANIWRLDKIHFDKDGYEQAKVYKKNIGIVAGLIREARAEIEGERGVEISNPVHIYLPAKDALPK